MKEQQDAVADRNGSVEPAEMVVQDIVERLRNRAETWLDHCYDDAEQDREAADEIERLQTLVTELLPFMYAESAAGISMSAPPEGHQRDDCDDCDWYYHSLDWRKRIDAGEFDGYKTSGTSSD